MKHDFAVVGGGPSGCFAAMEAAVKGDVIVFEEHGKQPVHCAGLISTSGFKILGIEKGDFVLNEINGARLFSPLDTVLEVRTNDVKAYAVDRSLFDRHILEKALDKGVSCENSRVDDVSNCTLTAGGKKFKADKTILASGTNYTLQKKIGLQCPREFLVGAQYEMKVECEEDMVELHFTVPGFFAWIIPLKDKARVGLCTKTNPTPHLESFIKKLEGQGRIKNKKILDKTYGIIPFYNPRLKTEYENINLVGDAAGHVKATTGGGVVMGGLAARHASSPCYERLWREAVGRELSLHLRVYRFVSKLSDGNIDRLFKITCESRSSLERYGDMDYASKTLTGLLKEPRFTLKFLLNAPYFLLDLL